MRGRDKNSIAIPIDKQCFFMRAIIKRILPFSRRFVYFFEKENTYEAKRPNEKRISSSTSGSFSPESFSCKNFSPRANFNSPNAQAACNRTNEEESLKAFSR